MNPSYKTDARVIVTRPIAQSDRLSSMIEDAGGTAIRIPALEIRTTEHPEIAEEIFARIGEFQSIVFISPNAVRHGLQFIQATNLDNHQCIAIGASTAQAMELAGIRCDIYPKDNFTSEALLELPELQHVDGQNFLIVRGNGGRDLLGNELTHRGAKVSYAEVYERLVPAQSAQMLNDVLASDGADVLIANSGETLTNVVDMVDPQWRDALLKLQVVTGSARVAQAAINAGFVNEPVVASTPDDQALMKAISSWSAANEAPTDETASDPHETTAQSDDESTDTPPASTVNEESKNEENAMTEERNNQDVSDTTDDNVNAAGPDPAQSGEAETRDAGDENAETVDSPASATLPPVETAPAKRGGAGVAWLALLVSLVALAGTAWTWWQGTQSDSEQATFDVATLNIPTSEDIREQVRQLTQTESGRLSRQIEQQQDTIERIRDEQSNMASQIRTQKRSVENLTEELTDMSDSISAMRGVSASVRNTWVRAETEYFLQTANTRLQLAGDIKSAIQALKAADERIVALGDPSLTPVRAQLSEDLLALESLPHIDIEGIALTLNSMAARITALPLRNQAARNFMSDGSSESSAGSEDGAWTKIRSALSDTVGGFVRVSPTEDAGAVLLAPEQVYFLFRNLELQLQAARVAALQSKQNVYNDSLASSRAWLEEYFDLDDPGVETMLGRIIDLQAKTIELDLPDISRSLNLIRAVAPVRRSSGAGAAVSGQAPEAPPAPVRSTPSDEPES